MRLQACFTTRLLRGLGGWAQYWQTNRCDVACPGRARTPSTQARSCPIRQWFVSIIVELVLVFSPRFSAVARTIAPPRDDVCLLALAL